MPRAPGSSSRTREHPDVVAEETDLAARRRLRSPGSPPPDREEADAAVARDRPAADHHRAASEDMGLRASREEQAPDDDWALRVREEPAVRGDDPHLGRILSPRQALLRAGRGGRRVLPLLHAAEEEDRGGSSATDLRGGLREVRRERS